MSRTAPFAHDDLEVERDEGAGHLLERLRRRSRLQLGEVRPIDIRFVGELLLGESSAVPELLDRSTEPVRTEHHELVSICRHNDIVAVCVYAQT